MGERLGKLKGVQIFRAGTHRGKTYTERDLDDMVDNFNKFSTGPQPLLRVPAVPGHEEDQALLERSDTPALAWPERLYREGPFLYSDMGDITPAVKNILDAKAYRTVSSEVYDKPPEGIPAKGKMLRRVAFLGGEIPQIKDLSEIPAVTYTERGPTILKFSEIRPGSTSAAFWVYQELIPASADDAREQERQQMIRQLQEHGLSAEALEKAPPETLAEMLRLCDSLESNQQREADKMASAGDQERGKIIKKEIDRGHPADQAAAIAYDKVGENAEGEKMAGEMNTDSGAGMDDAGMDSAYAEFENDPNSVAEDKKALMGEHYKKMAARCYADMQKYGGRLRKMGHKFDEVPIDQPGHSYEPGSKGGSGDVVRSGSTREYDEKFPPRPDGAPTPITPDVFLPGGGQQEGPRRNVQGADSQRLPEQQPSSITVKYSEKQVQQMVDDAVKKALHHTEQNVAALNKFAERRQREERRGYLQSKVENWIKQGKVLPAEVDGGLIDALLISDHSQVVKFGEREGTQLEHMLRAIESRPQLVRFGERFKDPVGKQADQGEDVAQVEKFCEQFSKDLDRIGITSTEVVKTYKAAKADERKDYLREIKAAVGTVS